MHDSGAALAEPDDAPLPRIRLGSSSCAGGLQLPGLLDPRLVRAELTRLRTAGASRPAGLIAERLAASQGRSDGGRAR